MNKPTLLVPIAGKGQRFVDRGYTNPKPLIIAGDKHIIDYSMDSINIEEYNPIFIVRKDHVYSFGIDEVLRNKFGQGIEIVVTDEVTAGSVCSCQLAEKYIDPNAPLVIYTLDVAFSPVFSIADVPKDSHGFILTFRANSQAYSYVQLDSKSSENVAVATAEKKVISQNAAVGIYYFKYGGQFIEYARQMVQAGLTTNQEYYICPLYNLMIKDGLKVTTKEVDVMHLMGTPEELDFFVTKTLPTFGKKPVALCSDHSGYELKESCVEIFKHFGLNYIDFGTYSPKDCDYNDFVIQAGKHIRDGICDFGIGLCRTGQGINIAANKIKGVRAALVFDEYTAEYARRHNCANFFSIPTRYVDAELLYTLIRTKFGKMFDGGRHMTRVIKAEKNENS